MKTILVRNYWWLFGDFKGKNKRTPYPARAMYRVVKKINFIFDTLYRVNLFLSNSSQSLLLPIFSLAIGDVDIGCYIPGECVESEIVFTVFDVPDPESCSRECTNYGQECGYFTHKTEVKNCTLKAAILNTFWGTFGT